MYIIYIYIHRGREAVLVHSQQSSQHLIKLFFCADVNCESLTSFLPLSYYTGYKRFKSKCEYDM